MEPVVDLQLNRRRAWSHFAEVRYPRIPGTEVMPDNVGGIFVGPESSLAELDDLRRMFDPLFATRLPFSVKVVVIWMIGTDDIRYEAEPRAMYLAPFDVEPASLEDYTLNGLAVQIDQMVQRKIQEWLDRGSDTNFLGVNAVRLWAVPGRRMNRAGERDEDDDDGGEDAPGYMTPIISLTPFNFAAPASWSRSGCR